MQELATSSCQFLKRWMKCELILGLANNESNDVIESVMGFEAWIQDFRVVGNNNLHAKMHFKFNRQLHGKH